MTSSPTGGGQPLTWKPPVGSSLGPPGPWITPSSVVKAAPTILRIDRLAFQRGLDLRDVDLAHRHHRFERAFRSGLVGIAVGLEENAGRDLPGKAPAILAPAAHAFLASVAGDRIPV